MIKLTMMGHFFKSLVLLGLLVSLSFPAFAKVRGSIESGAEAYYAEDYLVALREWVLLARLDDARAQHNIGVLYFYGLGVKKNYKLSHRWFERAAKKSFARAQHNLGWMYQYGLGVKKNINKAQFWYKKAAAQDFGPSQNQIGSLLYQNKEYNAARRYLLQAARRGQADAQFLLGEIYHYGLGTQKSMSKSLRWYQAAANNDQANAAYALGRYYIARMGSKDNEQAMDLLSNAVEGGNIDAINALGWMVSKGHILTSGSDIALKLFLISAQQGYAPSAVNIAALYSMERDGLKTYMWLLIAEQLGAKNIEDQKVLFAKALSAKQIKQAAQDAKRWLARRSKSALKGHKQ